MDFENNNPNTLTPQEENQVATSAINKNEENTSVFSASEQVSASTPVAEHAQVEPETVSEPTVEAQQASIPPQQPTSFSYPSYAEWRKAQQEKAQPAPAMQNDPILEALAPKKKKGHPVLLAIGGVVVASLLFVAGLKLGTSWHQIIAPFEEASKELMMDPNKPSVSITSTSPAISSSDSGMSGEEVYEKVSPSVVSVVASNLATDGQSSGSGVIMSADGYVITNQHVIDGAQQVKVITSDGMQYNAKVVGADEQTDLAVLKIAVPEGKSFTPAEFGDSTKIRAGEKAFAIGSPSGVQLANTITTGSISAISRDITIDDRVMTLIQTDASINPGNSGGALINKYGQVIGITSAKLSHTGGMGSTAYEGLGFAIPMDSAKEIIDELIQRGYVSGRPAIGITGYNISERTARFNDVPQGVLVTAVDPNSDAAKQGLQANDIIVAVNGKEITTMNEINAAKKNLKAGDTIELSVYRMSTGDTVKIKIHLADQHDLAGTGSVQERTQRVPRQQQPFGGYYFMP